MALSLVSVVTILYVSINVALTLFVSILGVKYVRDEANWSNILTKQSPSKTPNATKVEENEDKPEVVVTATSPPTTNIDPEQNEDANRPKSSNGGKDVDVIRIDRNNYEEHFNKLSNMGFVKLWLKMVWKMRSCYSSLFVHAFDVLTDILVIIEWWSLEEKHGDKEYIDSRLMAWCGIIVLLTHRAFSTLAIWLKDGSLYRSFLQFLDILIFEEIHASHKKIVAQFRNHDPEEAVKTTISFKYIRSLEAVFESIPQSVLQMVFLIRTNGDYDGDNMLLVISCLSIAQSIISMTNSILKQDNLYMDFPKFKPHRKRLPPTFQFLKV